ncbi:glycine betaine ABC transporter substrate-binding protein [Cryobacterium adonitolivorans]|uniref:Glycine betaine ABC transporter substrate-binding protein n=1 Tax=Cryobacterium adonitolivorans TaxID=1259189 RepID=A0A4R8W290_9MICO|nr:glycine betaine ABC transporter substrate-binding protein [Cryobacterium adonitolivorans]TFC01117.1 glycine betaine ABC transporter substrate-binding protein [Cryobacterium adonitolivorans]
MKNRSLKILSIGAIGMLTLAGCTAAEAETVGDGNSDNKDLTIAVFNGWDEGIAASELWKAILDEKGYNVELEYADVAPVYAGLSTGDYDVNLDVWLPNTHASYLEEYGDDITELAAWNTEAKNTIAVNADAPIDSLAELAENADLFGNTIVGIEPGAGLTEAVTNNSIPTYGLEDMDYQTSSTAAMLTELTAAEKSGENIAVTLWEPHWAYGSFDLKNLEDPEGTLGDAETIHAYGKKDFSTDFPQATEWLGGFELDLERLYSLETAMFVDYDGQDYGPIVAKWIEDNQEYVDSLTA